ncbi:MAG: peptide deformylase [candidate division Zixibacteria bacterium 4484_95]|nr:MAG: peptide deformylase [candidate division Zixibacteria bacterium 4484_95]
MKILPIRIYGDEVLRKKSDNVENIDGNLVDFLETLLISMKHAKGLGLAANQIGINKRIFAVDMSYIDVVKEPIVIINPELVDFSGSFTEEEGCLSLPGLFQEITRPEKATVSGLDRDGKEITIEGKGLIAKVFLHEIDHLNGKLIIDYLSKSQLGLLKGKLKKIKSGRQV